MRVSGLRFRVAGFRFRVSEGHVLLLIGSAAVTWTRVQGLTFGFGVRRLEFGVWSLGFGVWGFRFRVSGQISGIRGSDQCVKGEGVVDRTSFPKP